MNSGIDFLRQKLILMLVCFFGVLPSVFAQDYWGQKNIKQPNDYIFGYGSLINAASRNSSVDNPIPAIPVRVSSQLGFARVWNVRVPSGFTALGLIKANATTPATTINGVLFPVVGSDIAAYDRREQGYTRLEIPRVNIEALSWQGLPQNGRIWVYVPSKLGEQPGVGLPIPNGGHPLLQSYIDVVIEGALYHDINIRLQQRVPSIWNRQSNTGLLSQLRRHIHPDASILRQPLPRQSFYIDSWYLQAGVTLFPSIVSSNITTNHRK